MPKVHLNIKELSGFIHEHMKAGRNILFFATHDSLRMAVLLQVQVKWATIMDMAGQDWVFGEALKFKEGRWELGHGILSVPPHGYFEGSRLKSRLYSDMSGCEHYPVVILMDSDLVDPKITKEIVMLPASEDPDFEAILVEVTNCESCEEDR